MLFLVSAATEVQAWIAAKKREQLQVSPMALLRKRARTLAVAGRADAVKRAVSASLPR